MEKIKVIITGATGMVGEGVMLECLHNDRVAEVLIVNRRHYDLTHPKLKELLIPDFLKAEEFAAQLTGYDGCFFCAGISSIGMKEDEFTRITYDTTLLCENGFAGQSKFGLYLCFPAPAPTALKKEE
jgi:nucleoside-diphosphate-sugar epimerase